MKPLEYLNSLNSRGIRPGLERMNQLMTLLEHPESKFKSIHVTGTNGKGSVCALLESILRASGYRTGLYTSPHLIDVRERIQVNGKNIDIQSFNHWIQKIRLRAGTMKHTLTYFEFLTAVAFSYFAQNNVECAIVEVGLGGRLDATNILPNPELTIITNISLEHTHFLGNSINSIAKEKAGIIKKGSITITSATGTALKTIRSQCAHKEAKFIDANNTRNISSSFLALLERKSNLKGTFQKTNIKTVLNAILCLKSKGWTISKEKIISGFQNVQWPGRFQWETLRLKNREVPLLIDGAHNPNAIKMLLTSINESMVRNKKCLLIFNCLKDKNRKSMASQLIKKLTLSKIFIPSMDHPRSLNPKTLKNSFLNLSKKIKDISIGSVNEISKSIDNLNPMTPYDWILMTGSFVLIGDFLRSPIFLRSLKNYEKK